MKHINRIDMSAKNMNLVKDFSMPDYTPTEYPCPRCGVKLKLYHYRVLYCRRCHRGFLHPRYKFDRDAII